MTYEIESDILDKFSDLIEIENLGLNYEKINSFFFNI